MMRKITLDMVRPVLQDVAENAPDMVQEQCQYRFDDDPDRPQCIAAQVLDKLGAPIPPDDQFGTGIISGYEVRMWLKNMGFRLMDDAAWYLEIAQQTADDKRPWKSAWQRAELQATPLDND